MLTITMNDVTTIFARLSRHATLLLTLAALSAVGCLQAVSSTNHPDPSHTASDFPQRRAAGDQPIQVVCTTGMVADLVRQVGGSEVQVVQLMGAGVDPHLYKASPGDVAKLSSAEVVFYSGWHLEGKMAEFLARLSSSRPSIAVAEGVDEARLLSDEQGLHDPHLWFDVQLWSLAAEQVAQTLVKFDPDHASDYQSRLTDFQTRLAALDIYAREQIATIPAERRVLVTAHDAFRYFGRAYDLEVRGIQGLSTDSEAGVRQINELVDFLVAKKIKAVFVETSVSDQNVQSLLEGCGAQSHTVIIGGELYSDALGDPGTEAGTYEGMIRHNVDIIVKALK